MYLRRPEEFEAASLNAPGLEQGTAAKIGGAKWENAGCRLRPAPGLSAGRGLDHAAGQRGAGVILLVAVNC